MGGRASSTTAEIYVQVHTQTAISTALHPKKVNNLLRTFTPFLHVRTWKTFSITSKNIKFTMEDIT